MNTKIIIESFTEKNGWYNLKTDKGEVSVIAQSAPQTAGFIKAGKEFPLTVEVNLVEKGGKQYGWDLAPTTEKKPWGGKAKSPEEIAAMKESEHKKQLMIIAQSSASTAVQFYAQRSGVDEESVLKFADKIFNFVLSKV